MSNNLLQQLEDKINQAIDSIEYLREQVKTLESNNTELVEENNKLREFQCEWEKNLNNLLQRLNTASSNNGESA